MFKKILLYQLACYFIILTGSSTIGDSCCGQDQTVKLNPSDTITFLEVTAIQPRQVLYGGGTFDVTLRAGFNFGGSINGDFKLTKEVDACPGLDTASITLFNRSPVTIHLNTSLISNLCDRGVYSARLYSPDLPGYQSYSYTFTWGHELLPLDTFKMDRYRMASADTLSCDSAISCVRRSFNNPDPDHSDVRVLPILSYFNTSSDDNFSSVTDLNEISDSLDVYARGHNIGNDSFRVYYALNNSVGSGNSYVLGVSANTALPGNHSYKNWSFIFMKRIDNIISSYHTNWVNGSVYNHVSVHELLHQVGKLGNSEHTNHSGIFADSCALWLSDHLDTLGFFADYTSFYYICGAHISSVRNYLHHTPIASPEEMSKPQAGSYQKINDGKYDLTMTLAKDTYKKFEPVTAKFKLVNLDNKSLRINGEFNPLSDEGGIKISDNLGHIWNTNKLPFGISLAYVGYVLQPKDTLEIAMPINNWGEFHETQKSREWYFDQFGYFPSGRKYTASYDSPKMKSNEVTFEVIDLNDEDINLLNQYSTQAGSWTILNNIVNQYPNNTFAEYVEGEALINKYWGVEAKDRGVRNSISDYETFLKKYPDTYFIYDDRFMTPYYVSLFDGKSYRKEVKKVMNQNVNSSLNKLLKNSKTGNRIKNLIKQFKNK